MLLEKPLRRTPSKAIDVFDHPVQEMEAALGMYEVVTARTPRARPATTKSRGSGSGNRRLVRRLGRRHRLRLVVILQRNPFISAIALLGNLASLAMLFLLLQADFVAAAQVIVYAGAMMVMFLFVIAYSGRAASCRARTGARGQIVFAGVAARRDPGRAGARRSARSGARQRGRRRRTTSARRRPRPLVPDDVHGARSR